MPTLLNKPTKIEVVYGQALNASDWKLGVQVRGFRSVQTRRTFRLTFDNQHVTLWQFLRDLFVEAGCGAGEIDWPDAPGGAVVVRMRSMPTVAQNVRRFSVSCELEELLSTDN